MNRITYTIKFLPDDVSLDDDLIDPDIEIKDNFILSQIESIIRHNPEDYIICFQGLEYSPQNIHMAIDLIRSSVSEEVIFWYSQETYDTISEHLQSNGFLSLEDECPEIETGRNILIVASRYLQDIIPTSDHKHISNYYNFARSLINKGARSVSYLVFVRERHYDPDELPF